MIYVSIAGNISFALKSSFYGLVQKYFCITIKDGKYIVTN